MHPRRSAALLLAVCIIAIIVTNAYVPRAGAWVTVAGIFVMGRAAVMLRRRRG
jgi:hypothetical protein